MFKHVLIPTDGSPVAAKAVKAGLKLAAELGARVTAYVAVAPVQQPASSEGYLLDASLMKQFQKQAVDAAERQLEAIAKLAKAAGVSCTGVAAVAYTPYEGIIETAKKRKCDAIFMASHGRRGLAGLVLGSVTHKVLTHSKIPVLVYR